MVQSTERSRLHKMALSRWEGEGGATAKVRRAPTRPCNKPSRSPALTDAELVQLRVRVIALENLVIAMLAQAPQCELALAREMAAYISPRPGRTPHPMTLRAAIEMLSLADRSRRFRTSTKAMVVRRTRRGDRP